jgi:prepilin-type N-terminal cleavage/methylation domain-containing protein
MRAFSLIEMMVVVAIIGVVAALAVPSLLPEIHKAQLNGAADGAANMLARARTEAMASRRCTRVVVQDPGATTGRRLAVERLNNFNCESPAAGTRINAGQNLWVEIDWLVPESNNVTYTFAGGDGGQWPTEPGGNELRFRPNGRVFSAGTLDSNPADDLTNDDAVLVVKHSQLASGATVRILVDGNGLICAMPRGVPPPGGPANFSCPN